MTEDVLIRAGRLAAEGEPHVLATVVSVERPASTRRGDRALVTPGGDLFGWVGDDCVNRDIDIHDTDYGPSPLSWRSLRPAGPSAAVKPRAPSQRLS